MRKFYLTLWALCIVATAWGQVSKTVARIPAAQDKAFTVPAKAEVMPASAAEELRNEGQRQSIKPNLNWDAMYKSTYWETLIGMTRYDLQSNASLSPRLAKTNNTMSAGFTMSFQNVDYTDRGTGYNYYGGSVWDELPTQRLESVRVGWPNVLHTAGGNEVVITHDGNGALRMVKRTIGSSANWSETEIPNPSNLNLLWPRAAVGGADGNTIHLIVLTEPVGNTGTLYDGLDGALLYYRSTDQGATWDIQGEILPGMTSSEFVGFGGDCYFITAKGNKVAFASFDDLADTFIMISNDNGTTWTKRTIVDFPVDMYVVDTGIDLDGDLVADTLFNSDKAGTVFIDANNAVHVFFGNMRYMDEDLTDGNWQYFPGTNGISYWRDDFNDNEYYTITGAMDLDGDGELTLADGTINSIALYFISLSGQPSVGQDAQGNLYLSFSSFVESHYSLGDQNYRHIYLVKSEDGGNTWTEPVDATPDVEFDGYENVFAYMSPQVDSKIHIVLQRDTEPGLHVRGDEDPADDNEIIYLAVTTDLVIEASLWEQYQQGDLVAYPNPAEGELNLTSKNWIGAQLQICDATGKLLYSDVVRNELYRLDVSAWPAGVYTVHAAMPGMVQRCKVMIK